MLDDYILGLARSERPRICFVPTASGDNENYIVRFYRRFTGASCQPTHLELFRRSVHDLAAFAQSQDVLYVGGGNVANLLSVWRLHGFDNAARAAYGRGTVLAGVSAGSLCWFRHGVTDSFGDPELSSIDGLGLIGGSHCPHYDEDAARRPAYSRLVRNGMPAGIAADVGVALHFVEGALHRVVSSRPSAFQALVVLLVILVIAVPLFILQRARTKLNQAISPDATCRGLVVVKRSSYDTRQIDGRERIFVRAEVENRSRIDVSDPVLRVVMVGPEGEVEDTFLRTVYGANIAPRKPYWLRVEGDITVDPIRVKEVLAEVASADCKPAWE